MIFGGQVAQQRCIKLQARFRAEMSFFSVDQLVWVDETGCDKKSAIRKAGYALKGITPECHRKLVKGKRLSSMAAISVDGVIAADFMHDSMNAEFFYEFAQGPLIPNLLPFDGQKFKVGGHHGQLLHPSCLLCLRFLPRCRYTPVLTTIQSRHQPY